MYEIDNKTQMCAKRKLFYSRCTLFTIKQLKNTLKILGLIGIFENLSQNQGKFGKKFFLLMKLKIKRRCVQNINSSILDAHFLL